MAVGGKANATSQPEVMGVQVTTSLYNTAIPLLMGKRRTSSRVIWYGYFGPSSGSGKKGKGSKKSGITTYQANLDLLTSFGPIWNVQSTWTNSSIWSASYQFDPPFSHMGAQTFAITNSATASGSVTIPSGYNCDYISAVSFTPSTPNSAQVNVYGDPLGEHTITEAGLYPTWNSSTSYDVGDLVSYTLNQSNAAITCNFMCIIANTNAPPDALDSYGDWLPVTNYSEQWLYNIYNNYENSGAGAVAWRPGNWEFGETYCNNAFCTFPIGTDHGNTEWTAEFPNGPVTGTITVFFQYTKANHDNPITYIKYEFEAELGSGNEYGSSGQQLTYPELSGFGGVEVDLGASGTAPELDTECSGLYSLTKTGQCNPADMILDIILSGNIFFGSGLNPSDFTPVCFSHGLNFGGDPTRINQLGGSGYAGSLTWPPVISFPYVLPMAGGAGNSSGSAFQILADPPAFDQGIFDGSNYYNVNAIVEGSDGNFYRALCTTNADPVSGGTANWAPYTGSLGGPQVVPVAVDASASTTGSGATNQTKTITPGRPTDYAIAIFDAAPPSSPAGWTAIQGNLFGKQLSNITPVSLAVDNSGYETIPIWANAIATIETNGTPTVTAFNSFGGGAVEPGPINATLDVVKGQALIGYCALAGFGEDNQAMSNPPTLTDSFGTEYTVIGDYTSFQYNPETQYSVAAFMWVGFATETGTTTCTLTIPANVSGMNDGGVLAYDGLAVSIPAPFTDGLTDVRNYCHANAIYTSCFLTSQQPAADILTDLCEIANCTPVWNGQCLDFVPYSEVAAIGGGYLYTPRTASGPIAVLDSNYFVVAEGNPPVTVKQENMQSVINILDINYNDAGYDAVGACGPASYQSNSVRICDAQHASQFGPMNGSPRGFDDYLNDSVTATNVGWPIMNRQRFADPYTVEFELPQTIGSLLDPMDLITVVDPQFGGTLPTGVLTSGSGQQDVRISDLSEDNHGVWSLSCERFMYGMCAPSSPSIATATVNVPIQQGQLVAAINAPYFFEPTAALAVALGMSAEGGICIAVSDSDPNYGGCIVNVSTDGGDSYNPIGSITGNSTMGVTYSEDYPSSPSPDADHTLYVDLTDSDGELDSYTSGQQNQLIPIMLLDNSGAPGTGSSAGYTTTVPYEIISYGDTSLVATSKYSAAPPILRGQLGSVPADHPIGSVVVDLSTAGSNIFKYAIPNNQITGNVLYFKFQSFNLFKTGVQDITTCTAYTYTVTGQTNPTSPTSPTSGGSYTISPNPCLYQGRSGGWSGIDPDSGTWTNTDDIYFPPVTVNTSTGAVSYDANDAGTAAFTGPGQTVYVCIYDPTQAGGTPTVDVQPTNEHATTPGYFYLGQITSAATPTTPGNTGGSSAPGGPQASGSVSYAIEVNGVLVPVTSE